MVETAHVLAASLISYVKWLHTVTVTLPVLLVLIMS